MYRKHDNLDHCRALIVKKTKNMKLYVGNLDAKINSHHLKIAFKEFGAVKNAIVVTDKATGESRGFGFVEMPNEEEAENVIKNVNGGKWEGKVLSIRKAY